MKLKEGAIITEVSGEKILVDAGTDGKCFRGLIKLNSSAAFMTEKLQSELSKEELVNAVLDEYEVDKETASKDVDDFIEKLKETGMIED